MHSLYKYSFVLIFLISCSSEPDNTLEANLLISPNYQFTNELFECKLNDGYTLLNLESFFSNLLKNNLSNNDGTFDIEVFFPKSSYVSEFILNLKNYSNLDIYNSFLEQLGIDGFDEIAECAFDKNEYSGLLLIEEELKMPKYINELLKCEYNQGFNYGTFRIAIDRFANQMNSLNIPYEAIYIQSDKFANSFIWINNFYTNDFSDVISSDWINNSEADEIKQEFLENAKCIEAKMYDAFLLT